MDTAASAGFQFQAGATTSTAYSIPINEATTIAGELEAGKRSTTLHVGPTAFFGVEMKPVQAGNGGFGLGGGIGSSSVSGVEITDVFSGSPAADARLAAGDTITSFAGVNVQQQTSENEISNLISSEKPGETVKVVFDDSNGNVHSANVTLGSGPAQ
jgi:S1-C subfamily serine protease